MNQKRRATIFFLTVLSVATFWFCYLIARPFLKPVFFAVVLAIVFYPLHDRVRKFIHNANAAALLSTLFTVLTIAVPAILLSAAIRKELTAVYQSLKAGNGPNGGFIPNLLQLLERGWKWLGQYVDLTEIDLRAELIDRVQQLSAFLLSQVAGFAGGITAFVIAAVISIFTLFYLFRDGRGLWRRLTVIIPLTPAQIEKMTSSVSRTITASMYGGLAVALAQGLLLGIGFWFLRLPSPVLWGMTTAIFSFVPFIGSGIVWFPAAILLMLNGHWIKGLIMLAWGAGVVGMADNVIRPLVISGQMHFHPLYVFFALLGGVQAFGIIGLFVGPVVLALAQALLSLIREEIQTQPDRHQEEHTLADE